MLSVKTSVLVFGGGVAGLWLLNRLRQAGHNALLLESGALGGGQTVRAQGIIHGGTKYTLHGRAGAGAGAVSGMPELWRACLRGEGEIDLRAVHVNAPSQHLWSPGDMLSRFATVVASRLLSAQVHDLERSEFPEAFNYPQFRGRVCRLDEPVLDVPSLVEALAQPVRRQVVGIDPGFVPRFQSRPGGGVAAVELRLADGRDISIEASHFVLLAGAGNEALMRAAGMELCATQRRPLHMVMARGDLPELYAHCLGASPNPRLTITTHRASDGEKVWYIGGEPAEQGVERDPHAQQVAVKEELSRLLPWIPLDALRWSSFYIDRAEPRQADGSRPSNFYRTTRDNLTVGWPLKLALAPLLSADILQQVGEVREADAAAESAAKLPGAACAAAPWEGATQWN